MKRFFKTLLLILAGLLLLAIIGAFALLTLVNPNHYKDDISAKVYELTGKELTIDGDVHWTFFPHFSLQIPNSTLNDPKSVGNKPFATVKLSTIRLKIKPLLHSNIKIGEIALDGVQLNLIRKANGQSNWKKLSERTTTPSSAPVSKAKGSEKNSGASVHSLKITDLHVSLIDEKAHQKSIVSIKQLQTNEISATSIKFAVEGKAHVTNSRTDSSLDLNIKTNVDFNLTTQNYSLNKMYLQGQLERQSLGDNKVGMLIKANAHYDNANQTLTLNDLKAEINNLNLKGQIKIEKAKDFSGHLTVGEFDLVKFINSLGQSAQGSYDNSLISAQFNFTGTKHSLHLEQLTGTMGNSKIKGNIDFARLSPMDAHFQLDIDTLDLDKLMPHLTPSTGKQSKAVESSHKQKVKNTTRPINTITASGSVTAGEIIFMKMQATDVKAKINAHNGIIKINPLTAKFYQGNYQAYIEANLQNDIPVIKATENLTHVDLGRFMGAVAKKQSITGTADIHSKGITRGNNFKQMLANTDGNASISIQNGAFTDIDMASLINLAYSKYKRRDTVKNNDSKTAFSSLSANFKIKKGMASNNDLLITSPVLTATGKGKISLVTQAVNYKMEVSLSDNLASKIMEFQDKAGGAVPFKVTGTLYNLNFEPDVPILLKRITEKRLGKEFQKFHKKIDKTSDDLGKQLKSIFD